MADIKEVGKKGEGLLRIPPDWYPPTLVVTWNLHRDLEASANADLATVIDAIADELAPLIDGLAEQQNSAELLVRSSARNEDISSRGQYMSLPCAPTVADVAAAVVNVWAAAGSDDECIAILLQPLIGTKMTGHLSNEDRVSRESYTWLASFILGASESTERWRVSGDAGVDEGPLACESIVELRAQLRRIAHWYSSKPSRFHLEWVWDGKRLWVVQSDSVPPMTGPGPGECWSPPRAARVNPDRLGIWRPLEIIVEQGIGAHWKKIKSIEQFRDAGLPIAQFWVLSGEDLITDLAQHRLSPELAKELQYLCTGYLVIRVDLTDEHTGLMLPRMAEQNDPQQIVEFLQTTAESLISDGVPAESICFIAHRYIRSRASAWTYSEPNSRIVTVDSAWGVADGMNWLPHDRFIVDIDSGAISRSVVGKPLIYDVLADRNWGYRDTPSEWIWRSSMSDAQILAAAQGAVRLATQIGGQALVMWFVGLLDGAEDDLLPWFRNPHSPSSVSSGAPVSPQIRKFVARTRSDIDDFVRWRDSGEGPCVLRLEPTSELVRDPRFVEQIIESAHDGRVTVELDGSPLCHPFYMIKKSGIAISCRAVREQRVTPMGKLVRDEVPELIAARGESAVSFGATGVEATRLLRAKLIEESVEALRTRTSADLANEIADVLEVIDAIRADAGLTKAAITRMQKDKRETRGGFQSRRVLVQTGLQRHNSEFDTQLSLPDVGTSSRANTQWQIRVDGDRIVVSYVPPMFDDPTSYLVELEGGNRFEIRYGPDGISFVQEPIRTTPNQPTLF